MPTEDVTGPQVANLAAKLLALNIKLTPPQLIKIIVETAERTHDGWRNLIRPKEAVEVVSGTGRLRLIRAGGSWR
ncbi:MAG: hypothetical protein HZC37_27010 [Burkholderiales bacterium]|nr:hypothetical protein [Burkholderiales bacterium]